ncbi:MAG: aldehyde dehydrogenase family protein, partial [Acidobacteriota bacterium]|nr:aldehyde dehydrogenase family protein [Acidobacteriota bacterium]
MAIREAVSTPLLIDGKERTTGEQLAVHDPHDGSPVGHAAAASTQDALDAVAAAERAWPGWAALPVTERIDICLKALATLPHDLDDRAEVLSRENGKIRFEATIDLQVFIGRFHEAAR